MLPGSKPDYPDRGDNHGPEGNNVVFADGHAEWVSAKRWIRSYVVGNDFPILGRDKLAF